MRVRIKERVIASACKMTFDMDMTLQRFNYNGILKPTSPAQNMRRIVQPLVAANTRLLLPEWTEEDGLVDSLREAGVHVPTSVDAVSYFRDVEHRLAERKHTWVRTGEILTVRGALGGIVDPMYMLACVSVALNEIDEGHPQQVEGVSRMLLALTLVNAQELVLARRRGWESFLETHRDDRERMERRLRDVRADMGGLTRGIGRITEKQANAVERCDGSRLRGGGGRKTGDEMYRICKKLLVGATALRAKRNRLSDCRNMLEHAREECAWMQGGGGEETVEAEAEVEVEAPRVRRTRKATPDETRAFRFQMQRHVGVSKRDMGAGAAAIHTDEATGLTLYAYTNHLGKLQVNYATEDMAALPVERVDALMDRFRYLSVHSNKIARWYADPNHDSRKAMRDVLAEAADVADDSFAVTLRDLFLRHDHG